MSPLILYHRLARKFSGGERSFQGISQLLSTLPGTAGNYARQAFYGAELAEYGRGCTISFGTIFSTARAALGDNVYVGARCTIGYARIGSDTLLGSNVDVTSGKHQHRFDDPTVPIRLQAGHFTQVVIGHDVWIGNGAVILADVHNHAVVAAGSVVVREVPEGAIAGGNPAAVLKPRPGWESMPSGS